MEEASYLMDRPAGGWSELVTDHTLDLKLAVIEAKIDTVRHELLAEMDRKFRVQTWSMITAMIALFGLLGAFLKL
jgi:hypothetical protein